jgi:AcrR family transcriptional regulator
MGSQERREREAEATRELILDAARRLFVRNGFEGTSMRAIARAIEYTPTAIYHHFEGKDELFAELCARDFRTLGSAFQQIGRVEDPVERIAHAGKAYVAFAAANPMHYQLMFMTMVTPEAGRAAADAKLDLGGNAEDSEGHPGGLPGSGQHESADLSLDAYAFLRESVAEAIQAGRFRPEHQDVDAAAQLLWGALHGLVALRIAKAHRSDMHFPDLELAARDARIVMLRGLLRDPDSLPDPCP